MREDRSPRAQPNVSAAIPSGLAAGLLAALAMNTFARAINAVRGGREARGAAPGTDRIGRGAQPPQAKGTTDDDAAVRVGSAAYRALTASEPSRDTRLALGTAVHYAFGATLGVAYGWMSTRAPAVRAGYGTIYGAAVWLVADEMLMPALRLSRGPRQLPAGVHAYALADHLIFGATLESATRLLRRGT
jgi:hypothetical protein